MVFWLGVVVSVLSFAVGYGPVARVLKARYPSIEGWHVEVVSLVVFVAGCTLTVIGHRVDVLESRDVSEQITRLQTTVRQVEATADILVAGVWADDGRGPSGWLERIEDRRGMMLIGETEEDTARLTPTGKIRFSKEAEGLTKVYYKAAAGPGEIAPSLLTGDLEKCVRIALVPIFPVPGAETEDEHIAVSRVIVDLWVNRSWCYHVEKVFDPPAVTRNDRWFVLDLRERSLRDYAVVKPTHE